MLRPTHLAKDPLGFTLVELMAVVAILGILSTVAIGSFSKHLRASYRTQVVADLSNLSIRQKTLYAVRGHYATTTPDGDQNNGYPLKPVDLASRGGSPIPWDLKSDGYTLKGASEVAYTRGGEDEHGFDALNFVPQNGTSRCTYGSVSGDGTRGAHGDKPQTTGLAATLFPSGLAPYYSGDWFYSYAYCDFDGDGKLWTFTTTHITPDVHADAENWGE